MFCKNCGKQLSDNARFCDGCGSPTQGTGNSVNQQGQSRPSNNTQENTVVNVLAYLGILFFLPLVACPESKSGRFHANQGLILLIVSILGSIALSIVTALFAAISLWLVFIPTLLSSIFGLGILALVIIGMINAGKGEEKPLPLIGSITIIK
ncbi:MAG: zinc-ribbon domain-containing protein [Eubacteriales bacterium]|nr:zinc-ribbon domain-containing protein [Eubacteriales bacterium]